ncbi:MAG: hypothetical protein K6A82_01720 [Prevotella sp.]|nr:hypothetical protein [Prevotella sp.]
MRIRKIALSLSVTMALCCMTVQAQDKRTYNYRTMPKAQLTNRVNNAKIEYKRAKNRTKQAKASYKHAQQAYQQSRKNYQAAQQNEKMKRQALRDAQNALKYRQKLRKMSK